MLFGGVKTQENKTVNGRLILMIKNIFKAVIGLGLLVVALLQLLFALVLISLVGLALYFIYCLVIVGGV